MRNQCDHPYSAQIPAQPLDQCADEMCTAYRQFFLREIHYLLKAESAEHSRHGLGLNKMFDAAAGHQYAAG